MRLIINADDLGLSPRRDQGIFECFSKGCLSSASLIVNGLSSAEAAQQASDLELPLGLHFNITEGRAVGKHSAVSPLLGAAIPEILPGNFPPNEPTFQGKHGTRKLLRAVDTKLLKAVETELHAQIDLFVELTGSLPTHLDGHQHIHILPTISELIASTLQDRNITKVRIPAQLEAQDNGLSKFLSDVSCTARTQKDVFLSCGLKTTNYFFGLSTMGSNCKYETLCSLFDQLEMEQDFSIEWMVHPGYADSCWGSFNCSSEREAEMQLLNDPRLPALLEKKNVRLCSYQDL